MKFQNKFLKQGIYILGDFLICISLLALMLLNKIDDFSDKEIQKMLLIIVIYAIVKVFIFFVFKIYKNLLEGFSIFESIKLMIVSTLSSILFLDLIRLIPNCGYFTVPEVILITIAEVFLFISLRLIKRVYIAMKRSHDPNKNVRTMIIGAGAGAKIVLDECRTNKAISNKVVALIDDKKEKIGKLYANIPVYGPLKEMPQLIKEKNINEVIIAIADLSQERLFEIYAYLNDCNVKIKRLPLLSEMSADKKRKVIDVDIDELLSRKQVSFETKEIDDFIANKVVMVTGAGGSIGSELTRQIFNAKPKKIILLDIYEHGIYDLQQELIRKDCKEIELITLVGSTYNEQRMDDIFSTHKPELVFHAAAYKHVPLMEDSPVEAIRTNVIGTYNVAKMADKYGAEKMVLVSTDKAVRPTNVMGATKRFAEMIIQYFAEKSNSTKYSAVRFGNVLGSNGSVIPLFKKQIEEGGPVRVTHKDMVRFFMTIPEAVSLILQSGVYASGGEIFILDMGKPVKIIDLAEKMIRQAGYVPYDSMQIVFTGLRPGEKMYEEVLLEVSKNIKTANQKIFIEEPSAIRPIEEEIKRISRAFVMIDNQEIKELLKEIIDTYKEVQYS